MANKLFYDAYTTDGAIQSALQAFYDYQTQIDDDLLEWRITLMERFSACRAHGHLMGRGGRPLDCWQWREYGLQPMRQYAGYRLRPRSVSRSPG